MGTNIQENAHAGNTTQHIHQLPCKKHTYTWLKRFGVDANATKAEMIRHKVSDLNQNCINKSHWKTHPSQKYFPTPSTVLTKGQSNVKSIHEQTLKYQTQMNHKNMIQI